LVFTSQGAADGVRLHYDYQAVGGFNGAGGYYRRSLPVGPASLVAGTEAGATTLALPLEAQEYLAAGVTLTAFNAVGESHYGTTAAGEPRLALVGAAPRQRSTAQAEIAASRFADHEPIVREALSPYGLPEATLTRIVKYNKLTDYPTFLEGYFSDPEYHFDNGVNTSGVYVSLNDSISNYNRLICAANDGGSDVAINLGYASHLIQDFYSHTNYVERWLAQNPTRRIAELTTSDVAALDSLAGIVNNYYEFPTFVDALLQGNPHYSTYAVPGGAAAFVTLYHKLGEQPASPAQPYLVGFVPWHGELNKDGPFSSEGSAVVNDSTLFDWAQRFAVLHTRKLYDNLSHLALRALGDPRYAGTNDSDGDGFSDEIEESLGADPGDAVSTPFGQASVVAAPTGLSVAHLRIQLNFARPGRDSLTCFGTLPESHGSEWDGQRVIVSVGGVVETFVLNGRGALRRDSTGAFWLGARIGPNRNARMFSLRLTHGSFGGALADEQLIRVTVKAQPVSIPVTIIFNKTAYVAAVSATYQAREKKRGTALTR
jgi:hypothetical protein